jgi:hypothetical protein
MQLIEERISAWEQQEEKRNVILKQRLATFLKYIEDDHEERCREDEIYFSTLAQLE